MRVLAGADEPARSGRSAPASSPASAASPSTSRDLVEWNYGDYEGKRTAEILQGRPGWQLFRDGCPGGESPADVGARADRVIARVRAASGNVLLFSSGHILRVLGARWLGLPPAGGRYFLLGTASLSARSATSTT